MTTDVLDELLATLDVQLHAFAVCQIEDGWRLAFEPMPIVMVHNVLTGGGVLRVGDRHYDVGPRHLIIIPPGVRQSFAHSEPALHEVSATDTYELTDGLLRFEAGSKPDTVIACGAISATYGGTFGFFDHLEEPLIEDMGHCAAVADMLQELRSPTFGTRTMTEALMKQCLVLVLRAHISRLGSGAPLFARLGEPRLVRAISAVIAHPAAPHSVESLAQEACMSRSSFAHHFVQTYGQTPFEFVQKTRLHHAARLLRTSQLPVKTIASSVGFVSRSHFSRAFREAFGTDPSTFRRGEEELAQPKTLLSRLLPLVTRSSPRR